MSNLATLVKQSSHFVTGRTAVVLLGFISFPVFTRVLSVAQYGTLSLVLKLLALFTVLGKAGMQNSVLRFYEEHTRSKEAGSARVVYASILIGGILISSLVALLVYATATLAPASVISPPLQQALRWGALYIVVKACQALLWSFLRVEGATKTYNALDVAIRAAAIVIVVWILLNVERSVRAFVSGMILVEGFAVAAVLVYLAVRGRFRPSAFDPKFFTMALSFGAPLIMYEFSGMILSAGDRLLVERFLGAEMLGFYSAAYNICTYMEEALMAPIGLALVPMYMKIWSTEGLEATRKFLSSALNLYVMAASVVAGGAMACAPDLVVFLGSRKLAESAKLVPILIIGLLTYATYHFFNAGLLIHKKTGVMVRIIVLVTAANVVINLLLIPRLQLYGAAITTVISYILFVALIARASFQFLPIDTNWLLWAKYVAAAAVSAFAASRVSLTPAALGLFVKGAVTLLLYAALVYTVDTGMRAQLHSLIRAARART